MVGEPLVEIQPPRGGPLVVALTRAVELGRECDGVLIDDALLSRRHLSLWVEGDQVLVEDLGSRNGTEVAGAVIRGPRRLAPGEVVRAGDTQIRLTREVTAPAPAPATDTAASRTAHRATIGRDDLRPTTPAPGSIPTVSAPAPGGGADDVVRASAPVGGEARATKIETVARQVVSDAAAMERVAEAAPQTGGTLTFLFSDIESSTQRAEAAGDNDWYRLLDAHNRLIERAVAEHGGTVVKNVGDGFMVTFGSARNGARAAIAIQRELASTALGGTADPIKVRIGLHTGEAIERDGDLFGLHVNVAARVANHAHGGQVLVSALTRAITESAGDLRFGAEEHVALKGLSGDYGVSELRWQAEPSAPADARGTVVARMTPSSDTRATTISRPPAAAPAPSPPPPPHAQ